MKRNETKHDHIGFDDLLDAVHKVEDANDNSVLGASKREMMPIWNITKPNLEYEHLSFVTRKQYDTIVVYARKKIHSGAEREKVISKLNVSISWLDYRVRAYRNGNLRMKEI